MAHKQKTTGVSSVGDGDIEELIVGPMKEIMNLSTEKERKEDELGSIKNEENLRIHPAQMERLTKNLNGFRIWKNRWRRFGRIKISIKI